MVHAVRGLWVVHVIASGATDYSLDDASNRLELFQAD